MKTTYNYDVITTNDKNKLRDSIIDRAEQGFEVDPSGLSTTFDSHNADVVYTVIMRKRPEAPVIDTGPGTDPTGGTPAANRIVVPFRRSVDAEPMRKVA